MEQRTFMYRAGNGELLYVGITQQANVRMAAHRKTSEWYTLATNIEYVEFPDRAAAMAAESVEIKSKRPRFNVTGNHEPTPDVVRVNILVPASTRKAWKAAGPQGCRSTRP